MHRFIARRGQPEQIRSDNGGNFVRGEKELRNAIDRWNQEVITEFLLQRNVQWIFNPPQQALTMVACGSTAFTPFER